MGPFLLFSLKKNWFLSLDLFILFSYYFGKKNINGGMSDYRQLSANISIVINMVFFFSDNENLIAMLGFAKMM